MTVFVLCVVFVNTICTQHLSKNELLEDLNQLHNAIVNAHPINLNPAFENNNPTLINELTKIKKDSFSKLETENQIRTILANLGCLHTSIVPAKINSIKYDKPSFPFQLWSDGIRLYAIQDLQTDSEIDSTIFPFEITAINEQPITRPLQFAMQFVAGDGQGKSHGLDIFNAYGHFLLRQQYPHDSQFLITSTVGKFKVDAIEDPKKIRQTISNKMELVRAWGDTQLFNAPTQEPILYLRIKNFRYRRGKKIHKELFRALKASNATSLIIDLRGNGGGKGRNASDLVRYFAKETIIFADIIYKIRKELRLQLSIQKLGVSFWELFNLHRRKKFKGQGRKYLKTLAPYKEIYDKKVYLLIDGRTGSAASNFAALMKAKAQGTIIGKTSGGGELSHQGGSYAKIKLKNSGIKIRFPMVYSINDVKDAEYWSGIQSDFSVQETPLSIYHQQDIILMEAYNQIQKNSK